MRNIVPVNGEIKITFQDDEGKQATHPTLDLNPRWVAYLVKQLEALKAGVPFGSTLPHKKHAFETVPPLGSEWYHPDEGKGFSYELPAFQEVV